jgi:hypothetical protein
MPLLRADDISFAIPNRKAVTPHYFSQRASEPPYPNVSETKKLHWAGLQP